MTREDSLPFKPGAKNDTQEPGGGLADSVARGTAHDAARLFGCEGGATVAEGRRESMTGKPPWTLKKDISAAWKHCWVGRLLLQ